jgi:hypothetical protein
MRENQTNNRANQGERRIRRRLRGMMETRTGKAVGYTSLVAPVIGFILNDLRKPNSLVRQLAGKVVNRFLESKPEKIEAIDITDQVELLDEKNNNNKLTDN